MIMRGSQEKSGLPKSHATIGGSVGTKAACLRQGPRRTPRQSLDKAWVKATFPVIWDTQIVRGIVKTAGVSEYGVIWETDKQQERISLEKVTNYLC